VGPNDWESEHVAPMSGQVASFWIDSAEVTRSRWRECEVAGKCPSLSDAAEGRTSEPGQPVTYVSAKDAATFCAWVGGRLPRNDEWLRVTTGEQSRRFPWGHTGLVCRRASFGLVRGPCAESGTGPDWTASRPDGKSELGLYDLVGNVSEIVKTIEGGLEVRGGWFGSDHAAELKSWSVVPYRSPEAHIGFRCAYDREPLSNDPAP